MKMTLKDVVAIGHDADFPEVIEPCDIMEWEPHIAAKFVAHITGADPLIGSVVEKNGRIAAYTHSDGTMFLEVASVNAVHASHDSIRDIAELCSSPIPLKQVLARSGIPVMIYGAPESIQ